MSCTVYSTKTSHMRPDGTGKEVEVTDPLVGELARKTPMMNGRERRALKRQLVNQRIAEIKRRKPRAESREPRDDEGGAQ